MQKRFRELKNLFSLICGFQIQDSRFLFLVSEFRFTVLDSGFPFPGFRVAHLFIFIL